MLLIKKACKRAATEKELSTLEKDKEGQSKHYLTYPKPPVLDMKRENRNINVAEKANIPKFSKLDNIVTALRLLELFFDVLVNMIVGCIKLYSHREKANISFEITNEKIRLHLSMLPFSKCHKLPGRKIYWKTAPRYFCVSKVRFNAS